MAWFSTLMTSLVPTPALKKLVHALPQANVAACAVRVAAAPPAPPKRVSATAEMTIFLFTDIPGPSRSGRADAATSGTILANPRIHTGVDAAFSRHCPAATLGRRCRIASRGRRSDE